MMLIICNQFVIMWELTICWIYTKIHMNCFYLESNQDRVDLKDVVACPVPLTGAK